MAQVIITSLDMVPGDVQERVYISQSDSGFRELQFYLYARGSLYEIPAGAAAVLNGRKPDGTAFSYRMTIVNTHTVKIAVQDQMSSVAGDVKCEVSIIAASDQIGSANFIMHVEEAPISNAVMSASDYQLFIEAIEAAGTIESVEQIVEDLNNLEDQLTADEAAMNEWKKLGTLLTTGTDLFTGSVPANPGKYYCSNAASAATLVNSPSQYAFALWVAAKASSDSRVLVAFDSAAQMYVAHVQNTGTNYNTTTASGWKRLLNFNDLTNTELTGTPTVPTPDGNTNAQIANVQYVKARIAAIPEASISKNGLMKASDKYRLDCTAMKLYPNERLIPNTEGGIALGNNTRIWAHCYDYLTYVCKITMVLHFTTTEAVSTGTVLIGNVPTPTGITPHVVVCTAEGASAVLYIHNTNGYIANATALQANKTYYGTIEYWCRSADSWWNII